MEPGPQFAEHMPGQQTLFPVKDSQYQSPLGDWPAARAAHHLGHAEMPYDPYHTRHGDYTPDNPAVRSTMQPHEIRRAHQHVEDHEWDPSGRIEPLEHYDPREGQTIMSIHRGQLHSTAPWRESHRYDREADPLELDHHGNVSDERHPNYASHAPQRSPFAAKVFAEHGRDIDIHPHTPLHTAQAAWQTGQLDRITGPRVDTDTSPVPIVLHGGTPYLMDGHHRRAAAAARGQTIRGRVVSSDQFEGAWAHAAEQQASTDAFDEHGAL